MKKYIKETQLAVGGLLFICSFFFEQRVLCSFIDPDWLAILIALTLELGKVMSIVWVFHLKNRQIQLLTIWFRIGLLTLSFLCSLLYLTELMDKPQIEAVRNSEAVHLKELYQRDLKDMQSVKDQAILQLTAERERIISNHTQRYTERITDWESLMMQEMDNTINGHFKGPRYKEFEAQRDEDIKALNNPPTNRIDKKIEAARIDYERAKELVDKRYDRQVEELKQNDFSNDIRVVNPHVDSLRQLLKNVFSIDIASLSFIFWFSCLMSLLMEVGIQIAFSIVSLNLNKVVEEVIEEPAVEEPVITEPTPIPVIEERPDEPFTEPIILDRSKEAKRKFVGQSFTYRCRCGKWNISLARHAKVQAGTQDYACSKCGQNLKHVA